MSAKSTLLVHLRNGDYNWEEDSEQGMRLLVKHQSEFPKRIRDAIREAATNGLDTDTSRILYIYNVTSSLLLCKPEMVDGEDETTAQELDIETFWNGPDSEIDTEEELELAIRFFPKALRETRPIDQVWEWDLFPIFWNTTSLKSLPFVPLLAELGREYGSFDDIQQGGILNEYQVRRGSPLLQIVTNKFILQNKLMNDHKFNRHVDESSLSVLMRLKEKGLLQKKDIWNCVDYLLNEIPSRTDKRLRFFLDWDPAILNIKDNLSVALFKRRFGTSLLEEFVNRYRESYIEDGTLERFQMIFALGLQHYPEHIGFLFYRNAIALYEPAFQMACDMFGEKEVARVVNESILKHTGGRSDAIQKLMFTAANNKRVMFDGLYFLVRRDPNAVIPLLLKYNARNPSTIPTKQPNLMRRRIHIFLVLVHILFTVVVITGIVWICLSPIHFFIKQEL